MGPAHIKTKFFISALILLFACPLFSKNIAVMPFNNITEDKNNNWIGAAFSETLASKISAIKEATVLEKEQIYKLLDEIKFQKSGRVDEKKALESVKSYGAGTIVFGSYHVKDGILRVSAKFVDAGTGNIIGTSETF